MTAARSISFFTRSFTRLTDFYQLAAIAAIAALPLSEVSAQSLIFSDNLSSSAEWEISAFAVSDASSTFGFDYSQFGIPEAPNTDAGDPATSGLRLSANNSGAFAGDAIAAVHEDPAFTGQYTVQVDLWMNWAANEGQGIGTTEHAGLYVGFNLEDAQSTFAPAQNGAGLMIDTDGDCSNCDYILAKDAAELDLFSGQYEVMDFGFGNQPGYDNTDGDIPTLFPPFDIGEATNEMNASGEQPEGALGFQWVTITAEVDTNAVGNGDNGSVGTAKFTVKSARNGNTLVVGTVDNSVDDDPNDGEDTGELPVSMEGGIGLMMIDFFGGAPFPLQFGFMVFDNVRVYDGFLTEEPLEADFNKDGTVDGDDFLIWQSNFGVPSGATSNTGDTNGDGAVDGADFLIWQEQFGSSAGGGQQAVPEPAALGAILMMAATLCAIRRRTRRV